MNEPQFVSKTRSICLFGVEALGRFGRPLLRAAPAWRRRCSPAPSCSRPLPRWSPRRRCRSRSRRSRQRAGPGRGRGSGASGAPADPTPVGVRQLVRVAVTGAGPHRSKRLDETRMAPVVLEACPSRSWSTDTAIPWSRPGGGCLPSCGTISSCWEQSSPVAKAPVVRAPFSSTAGPSPPACCSPTRRWATRS